MIENRVLNIGVHNGITYLKQPMNTNLIVSDTEMGEPTKLQFDGSLSFSAFEHEYCVFLIYLYYTGNFQKSK